MTQVDEGAARREIVAQRPDPADPDNWPDIAALPGRLITLLAMLDAEINYLDSRRMACDHVKAQRGIVEDAREALIALSGLSPLEAWRILHPHRLDALDGIYDCGGEECPPVGFGTKENADLHYRRWRFER